MVLEPSLSWRCTGTLAGCGGVRLVKNDIFTAKNTNVY